MGCGFGAAKVSERTRRMSRLALGTVQFGLPYGIANQAGQVTRATAKAMLQLAAANGIDTLDTAIAYGESESCLGETGTQGIKLVTKLPAVPAGHGDINSWVHKQVAASFSRLGVNSVYGLLLHRPDQLLNAGGQELFNALRELKETGLVQKIGVSVYAPGELDVLAPRYRFDLVQAPFSLIDRRISTSGWLQRLKQDGVEIHTRSAFLQGLLLMPRSSIPAKFAPWAELWDKWQGWLAHYSVTAVQACLAYPLTFPEIERVVIGADSTIQLEQIIIASHGSIPVDLPDLRCDDENLINPANWSRL
jgi:aryl-alcohol dehydrogenase-like predicted oxidoreductase